ncbi:hypothetical protein C0J52_07065 [Blattella germanica]|nr:hypothetical protein C0J52_07065 [Blattella germanica]
MLRTVTDTGSASVVNQSSMTALMVSYMQENIEVSLKDATTPGDPTIAKENSLPIRRFLRNTAIGCMEFSDMRPPAPDTGRVGTVLPPNNFASEDCCTTKTLTPATGLTM